MTNEKELKERIEFLEGRIKTQGDNITALTKTIGALNSHIEKTSDLREENKQLKQKNEALEKQITELKKETSGGSPDQAKKIKELEKELETNRKYIKVLKAEIAELKSQPGKQPDNLNEIINQAKNAKSIIELEKSISSLDSYRGKPGV